MKARYDHTFERGKSLVKYLMIGAIACGLAALLFTQTGSVPQVVLVFSSAAMLGGMVAVAWRMCRCPYCGKRIIAGVLSVKSCPACRRDLNTGRKVKKSQR